MQGCKDSGIRIVERGEGIDNIEQNGDSNQMFLFTKPSIADRSL